MDGVGRLWVAKLSSTRVRLIMFVALAFKNNAPNLAVWCEMGPK